MSKLSKPSPSSSSSSSAPSPPAQSRVASLLANLSLFSDPCASPHPSSSSPPDPAPAPHDDAALTLTASPISTSGGLLPRAKSHSEPEKRSSSPSGLSFSSALAKFRSTPGPTNPTPSSPSPSSNPSKPHKSRSLLPSSSRNSSRSTSPKPPLPAHHLPDNKGFRNPWPSAVGVDWGSLMTKGLPIEYAPEPKDRGGGGGECRDREEGCGCEVHPTRSVDVDWGKYEEKDLVATWLGHAGMLVQLPHDPSPSSSTSSSTFATPSTSLSNLASSSATPRPQEEPKKRPIRLLFDPIFSSRAGPSQWTGPKRFIPTPCAVKDLPRVDFCFISHSHYDHLDLQTMLDLRKHQPHVRYFVPLGLKSWFTSLPVPTAQVVEMDWWESTSFDEDGLSALASIVSSSQPTIEPATRRGIVGAAAKVAQERGGRKVKVTCVPAQHKSGRTALDQDTTLWCGWVVEMFEPNASRTGGTEGEGGREERRACVYHAGDTGYRSPHDPDVTCPVFKDIGARFGPIDFSMIPIWRGGSLAFLSWAGLKLTHMHLLHAHHVSPPDALRLHRDVRSRHSMGVHHGCFVGSEAESVEALTLLKEAREEGLAVEEGQGGGEGGEGPEREIEEGEGRVRVSGRVEDEGGFGCVECGETVVVPLDR